MTQSVHPLLLLPCATLIALAQLLSPLPAEEDIRTVLAGGDV